MLKTTLPLASLPEHEGTRRTANILCFYNRVGGTPLTRKQVSSFPLPGGHKHVNEPAESAGKVSGQGLYRAIVKKQGVLWGLLIVSFCPRKAAFFFSQSSTHKCSITFAAFPDVALKTSRIACKPGPFPSLLKYTVFTTDPIICVDNCLNIIGLTILNAPELNQKQCLFNIRV